MITDSFSAPAEAASSIFRVIIIDILKKIYTVLKQSPVFMQLCMLFIDFIYISV